MTHICSADDHSAIHSSPSTMMLPVAYEAVPVESTTPTFEVLAPATLPAGFVFWVELGKQSCQVTVPQGGVKEGQVFRVPFQKDQFAETKQWKDGLCACFGYGIFHPSLWNAWCCPQLLLSQVLTRLNMTWLAERAERSSPTFRRITFIFIALCLVDTLLSPPLMELKFDGHGGVSYAPSQSTMFKELFLFCLSIPMSIYSFILLVRLRAAVRNKYGIQTGMFGWLEDFWCVCCCHCCIIAQMARQTADYEQEPASCCSKNGLRPGKYTKVDKVNDDICVQIV